MDYLSGCCPGLRSDLDLWLCPDLCRECLLDYLSDCYPVFLREYLLCCYCGQYSGSGL